MKDAVTSACVDEIGTVLLIKIGESYKQNKYVLVKKQTKRPKFDLSSYPQQQSY